jgi:hypothetical protein
MPDTSNEINLMNCRQIEPYVIDLARGVQDDALTVEVSNHLRGCAACCTLMERERSMSSALRRLATTTTAPPADPRDEQRLLARFDAMQTRSTRGRQIPVWPGAAAASLVLVALLSSPFARKGREADGDPAGRASGAGGSVDVTRADARGGPFGEIDPSTGSTFDDEFVLWPGATAWPPFESGQLIRVDLPVDALPSLGLMPVESERTMVQADILVGQDGFARAVRLVR